MISRSAFLSLLLVTGISISANSITPAGAAKDMSTHRPAVTFVNLKDGEEVSSPVKIKMKIVGIKIRPAGEAPEEKTSGHHHLIIDGSFVPTGELVPSDAKHVHFGKGQAETELKLAPGRHTLTLQFADGAHRSFGEALSKTITVNVK